MTSATLRLGLPSVRVLESYRIWDSYFLPAGDGDRLMADIERSLPAIELGRIEKLCCFVDVGPRGNARGAFAALERWPDMLLGMIQLNPHDVQGALVNLDRWLRDGPMAGVYFPGAGPDALTCTHPNFLPIVERVSELGGVIMQHTWFKTGGKQGPGESTPSELAELAARFPRQNFICAHAGGEWERGLRAVRSSPNILVETSGFDATAGFLEMAVRELGGDRILFGSHLPSRSLGTELSKVLGADLTEETRKLILGANFRRLLQSILGAKGA